MTANHDSSPRADAASPPSAAASPDAAAKTGRSALLLTGAKFWFLVSGFVVQWALQFVLRDATNADEGKRLYGLYSTATGFAAILNAFVYQGTTQAVATFTGRDPSNAAGVKASAYKLQALLGGSLFGLWWLAAPTLARSIYDNPDLTGPLRYGAFILLGYAFYAVAMGSLTGRSLFTRQAVVDVTFSTLKVIAIPGAAMLLGPTLARLHADALAHGASVPSAASVGYAEAAVGGFATAGWLVLALALLISPRAPAATSPVRVGTLFAFQSMTMILSGLVTWVTQADLQLLNVLGTLDADAMARLSGEYRAAQLFATIPYQAVFAITFILFPLVSGLKDPEALKATIRGTSKYALLIAAPVVGGFIGAPSRAVGLLYGPEYASPAAAPLRWLVAGYLAFSVFFVLLTIVTAGGRPGRSVLLVAVMALVQGVASWWFIPRMGPVGAAVGSAVGMTVGWCVLEVFLRRTAGAGTDVMQLLRTLVCGAGAAAVTHVCLDGAWTGGTALLGNVGAPGSLVSKMATLAAFAVAGVVYVLLLLSTGALDADDRARFARIIGRKRARG